LIDTSKQSRFLLY